MNQWKKLMTVLAVVLLLLGDYLYWTIPLPLESFLPEAAYSSTNAQLIAYDSFFTPRSVEVKFDEVAGILGALVDMQVTRRPKFGTMSEPFLYLYLYYPDGYTCITVAQNGNISVVPDYRSDRQFYFDGGQELYRALQQIAEK